MEKETPWYLRPPTEEERRRYNAHPWDGTPDHLRPCFLESEIEMKSRLALEAAASERA